MTNGTTKMSRTDFLSFAFLATH